MGTKRHLTDAIATLCERSRSGPLLDLFSGMCAVGAALAAQRQVWTNDVQSFAYEFGQALFCSKTLPPRADEVAHCAFRDFQRLRAAIAEPLTDKMRGEEMALETANLGELTVLFEHSIVSAHEAARLGSAHPIAHLYGGTYFSTAQAVDIEAIRSLIDELEAADRWDTDERRWLRIALVIAADRVANSTGHFAQALAPKAKNFSRLSKQRRRSIWREWLSAISGLAPVRSQTWRRRNKSHNIDALELLRNLREEKIRPSVVYADPPYTKDQYSRYYGLLDTIIRHDQPSISGRGLVRIDGFKSSFSKKSEVESSLRRLVEGAAIIGADLIISYPSNGLCGQSASLLFETSRAVVGRDPTLLRLPHKHSSLGASKGNASQKVEEHLYRIAA